MQEQQSLEYSLERKGFKLVGKLPVILAKQLIRNTDSPAKYLLVGDTVPEMQAQLFNILKKNFQK